MDDRIIRQSPSGFTIRQHNHQSMEEVIRLLNNISPLSEELIRHLKRVLIRKNFEKRSYLLQEGQVSQYMFYLEKGMVRCFYDNDTQEVSIWFMNEGNVIMSVESFLMQIKSYQYIQALEDCTVWLIAYHDLEEIYRQHPQFNLHRSVLLEKYYIQSEERQRMLSLNTAGERYAYLLKNNPEIILRVPAKFIASYLNNEESYYGKIKAKIFGNNRMT